MQLSKRLSAVAAMVTRGNRLADVGCDHGYLSIALTETGIVPKAVAMDINPGPLARAGQNIAQSAAAPYIEIRRSDGLKALVRGEADTAVIAGMGGLLLIRILREGQEVLPSLQELILAPQSDVEQVRRFLQEQGFCIAEEELIFEDGKYYPVMRAIPGAMHYESRIEFLYGKLLLEARHPVLYAYLEQQLHKNETILAQIADAGGDRAVERSEEIRREMQDIRSALAYYEM